MSTPPANMAGAAAGGETGGKKAVHVKWAGKTIALGTFPSAEADEKCARAKALTRAWRSTMRPKPSRDWVMLELERLGVRVVSGRLGRKAGEEDDEKKGPGGPMDRNNSMGWPGGDADFNSLMQQRRSSSIGLSMLNDADLERRRSLGSLGPVVGMDGEMPPHRPLVGGGAAAAYEAARADHYAQKNAEQQRRASSLGLGIGGAGNLGGGGMPQMGFSVNPNQHYEMLKLHHMNLLNEIQETTLMMNLYQQQQLQQQQQQLQQQAGNEGMGGNDSQMALLLQQQQAAAAGGSGGGMDFSGMAARSGSMGLGSGGGNQQMEQLLRQQQQMMQQASGGVGGGGAAAGGAKGSATSNEMQEAAALENRLAKLKKDIAERQKEAEDLQASSKEGGEGEKRKTEDDGGESKAKRAKTEEKDDEKEDDS